MLNRNHGGGSERRACICDSQLPLTDSFAARDYISGDTFEIRRCANCGTGFTVPTPSSDTWNKYYPDSYYGNAESDRFPKPVEIGQQLLYRHRVNTVRRILGQQPKRVLDIGCGRGYLLREFQNRGCEVVGIELSEAAGRFARERLKIPILIGDFLTLQLPSNDFDVIALWHVLEHIEDPGAALREIHRVLRPGGILFLGVPNFGSMEARLTRQGWFHLDVPRHLNHFTSKGLMTALHGCGFAIERAGYWAPEYDLFSALQSFLNWTGLAPNFLYNALRQSGAKTRKPERNIFLQIAGHAVLLPLLAFPASTLAMLSPVFRSGATQSLWARKR